MYIKRPVYIIAFGVYNSKEVNVSGIQHYLAQMQGKEFRMENLNLNLPVWNYTHQMLIYIYTEVFYFRKRLTSTFTDIVLSVQC